MLLFRVLARLYANTLFIRQINKKTSAFLFGNAYNRGVRIVANP